MRIITGTAKGRKLLAPEGLNTRPTTDRVKESIFNIIRNNIIQSNVLDLFAGTGNLGLEAVSRGASHCVFTELNKNTYKVLKENIEILGFEKNCESYNQDAFAALKILGKKEDKYDIIFLDPPYSKGLIEKSIDSIGRLNLISDKGIIVSEADNNDDIPEKINSLKCYRIERYGRTKILFWTKED